MRYTTESWFSKNFAVKISSRKWKGTFWSGQSFRQNNGNSNGATSYLDSTPFQRQGNLRVELVFRLVYFKRGYRDPSYEFCVFQKKLKFVEFVVYAALTDRVGTQTLPVSQCHKQSKIWHVLVKSFRCFREPKFRARQKHHPTKCWRSLCRALGLAVRFSRRLSIGTSACRFSRSHGPI